MSMKIAKFDDVSTNDNQVVLVTEPGFTPEIRAVFNKKYGTDLLDFMGKVGIPMGTYLQWNAAASQGGTALTPQIEEMLTAAEKIVAEADAAEAHRRVVSLKGIAKTLNVPLVSDGNK